MRQAVRRGRRHVHEGAVRVLLGLQQERERCLLQVLRLLVEQRARRPPFGKYHLPQPRRRAVRADERPHHRRVQRVERVDVAGFVLIAPREEDGARLAHAARRLDGEAAHRTGGARVLEHEPRLGGALLRPVDQLRHERVRPAQHGVENDERIGARPQGSSVALAGVETVMRIVDEGAGGGALVQVVDDSEWHARHFEMLEGVGEAVRAFGQCHLREAEQVVGHARLLREARCLADQRQQLGGHAPVEHERAILAALHHVHGDEALRAAVLAHVALLEEVDGVRLLQVVEAGGVLRAQLAVRPCLGVGRAAWHGCRASIRRRGRPRHR
mmetsp:Transcript_41204/g.98959  ORF Transcript_41204/g.98959 Transcript_41204/m.98959 type:complete len:328 (-) Transcript_41204:924-1907(-)